MPVEQDHQTEDGIVPTIFDPESCLKKGLCLVAKDRSSVPYRLYYELHGPSLDGSKKIVLIMGVNSSSSGWSKQVDYFGKKPDHQVLVIDNRGVGNSDVGLSEAYKVTEMAQDVVELLDYVGWTQDRSINVCGVSMGGMISQSLCLLIPKRIRSVAFVSTKAGGKWELFPSWKVLYMFVRMTTQTISVEKGIDLVIDTLYPAKFLNQPTQGGRTERDNMKDYFKKRLKHTRPQPTAGKLGQLRGAMAHHTTSEELQTIANELKPAKILVLGGKLDVFISPVRMIELHDQLPGSELLMLEDAGHAICAQMPDQFNKIIERIIQEADQQFSS